MNKTGISWCDLTWNPVRGCTRVSEGCRHCYAEIMAARIVAMDRGSGKPEGEGKYDGLVKTVGGEARWTGKVAFDPEKLAEPLKRRRWAEKFRAKHGRRPRVFVNSMSDLFHEGLTFEQIAAVFGVMAACHWFTFIVLTKRPEVGEKWFEWAAEGPRAACRVSASSFVGHPAEDEPFGRAWPLPNVHLYASIEDQATAEERITVLLRLPAAVRGVSAEPLLSAVYLDMLPVPKTSIYSGYAGTYDALRGRFSLAVGNATEEEAFGRGVPEEAKLDHVIIGGESGKDARPLDITWARDLVWQCQAARVACFVKQLGSRPVANASPLAGPQSTESLMSHGEYDPDPLEYVLRHPHGADPAEWPEDLRVQELPAEAP